MSGRRDRAKRQQPADMTQGMWVTTEPTVDGRTFMVTIHVDGDRSWALTPDQARAYAHTCLEVCQRTEFDAAVLKLMHRKLGLDLRGAAEFLAYDVRADRPDIDDSPTAPLRFVPGVNDRAEGFIAMQLDGKPIGQLDPEELRTHALAVLEAPTAADLDAGLLRALRGMIGLDESVALAVIQDLTNYR